MREVDTLNVFKGDAHLLDKLTSAEGAGDAEVRGHLLDELVAEFGVLSEHRSVKRLEVLR